MPELEKILTKSLEPTGLILLVTACGGVLRYILQYSGLGEIIGNAVASINLPIVIVAFLVAALVRICVGSATVAMTMAAGIVAAMPEIASLSPMYLACVVAAVAGGATVCSHFNDSGFWLVRSLIGLDEKTTLKTWTIMETLVGGTCGNNFYLFDAFVAHFHDRAFTKALFYLVHGSLQGFQFFARCQIAAIFKIQFVFFCHVVNV